MQDDSAKQLHVEMHHVPHHGLIAYRECVSSLFQPARCVFHHGERFRQNFIQLLPLLFQFRNFGYFFLPRGGFCAQLVIGQTLELLVQLVDAVYDRHQAPQLALIFRA